MNIWWPILGTLKQNLIFSGVGLPRSLSTLVSTFQPTPVFTPPCGNILKIQTLGAITVNARDTQDGRRSSLGQVEFRRGSGVQLPLHLAECESFQCISHATGLNLSTVAWKRPNVSCWGPRGLEERSWCQGSWFCASGVWCSRSRLKVAPTTCKF